MKLFFTLLSLLCFLSCVHSQVKTKTREEKEEEKRKMESLITEELRRVKT